MSSVFANNTNDSQVGTTFTGDLKTIVASINQQLENTINLDHVGYVFSVQRRVMEALRVTSRAELLELVKKAAGNAIIADQGEFRVWEMVSRQTPSYYVHAHIANDFIYLKLKQVVESEIQPVFIKDYMISMKDIYEQISETFWAYVNSKSDADDSYINDFKSFNSKLLKFIKQDKVKTIAQCICLVVNVGFV